jgi:MFS transporter, FHS family, L-fucose permease
MATTSATTTGTGVSTSAKGDYTFAFGLVSALFFMFGFITCLNDILLPHLKGLFTLNYTQASLVAFCFFGAYFIVSLPAGKLVQRWGYKKGTITGLCITALGCGLFLPAAELQSYPFFLFGLFILASGITIIQVAVNPYISILGPKETASSRLSLAQAFNSLGTTLAPLFGAALILSSSETTTAIEKAAAVKGPYLLLAGTLIFLAIILGFMNLPAITAEASGETSDGKKARSSVWQSRHLVLGAIAIFCYVGAEVAIGSYIVNFLNLPSIMNMPEHEAAKLLAYYWGGAMGGRFIGSVVMRKAGPARILTINAMIAIVLVLLAMMFSGSFAMIAILSIGLFNSIMFPTIFTLAIDDLGEHTAQASGILCMAIVGGAVIPLLQGMLADKMGLQQSFFLPVLCYLFIVHYGYKGHKHAH